MNAKTDWEIFLPGCSRPGKSREALYLSIPLVLSLLLGILATVILTFCFLLWFWPYLLLTGWFLSRSMPTCPSSGAPQSFLLLGLFSPSWGKTVLTSDEDWPREDRPWQNSSPSTSHHHWQAPKWTLHSKSHPSSYSLEDCSSLIAVFNIYSW